MATIKQKTFHKRVLPGNLVALSSQQGRELFREALALGGMESYFPLAEQFVTQSDPSFCSLSSLAMVLNALNFDPKRVWKGAWRWVSEETLQCALKACSNSAENIQKSGMGFNQFEALARCQGVRISSHRVGDSEREAQCVQGLQKFQAMVETVSQDRTAGSFLVANFSRKCLHQTGDGHFSPIGGYHREKGLVLLMDVARFKYPPYWLPIADLWEAMAERDAQTAQPRGYFLVSSWAEQQSRGQAQGQGYGVQAQVPLQQQQQQVGEGALAFTLTRTGGSRGIGAGTGIGTETGTETGLEAGTGAGAGAGTGAGTEAGTGTPRGTGRPPGRAPARRGPQRPPPPARGTRGC